MPTLPNNSYWPSWANAGNAGNYDWIEIRNVPTEIHFAFTENEFWNSKANLEVQYLPKNLLDAIFQFREDYGKPIRITSAYRNYIPSVPGAVSQSPHQLGLALDFQPIEPDPGFQAFFEQWLSRDFGGQTYASHYGITFVGLYPTFVHMDVMVDAVKRPWEGVFVKNYGYFPPAPAQVFNYDFEQPFDVKSPVFVWVALVLILILLLLFSKRKRKFGL